MVLWELTLATAYVLGLKRTYRLALRAQKRILGTKYPRIRAFTEGRTKDVFRMALNVHKEIQRRDISVGRSVGNWLLRILDRARPQANIRGAATPRSQSGPGRPSQSKIESSQPKIDSKNSQPKQVKAARLADSVDSSLSSQTTHVSGPLGARLRSRITDGLKLRSRPVMRPLPAFTSLGFWWQPVRQQSASLNHGAHAYNFPSPRVSQSGLRQQGVVFRDDIARLIHSLEK